MARESMTAGNVKIQQKHTRTGDPLMFIALPGAAVEWLGWLPGQYLTYFPTKAGELVLVPQDQLLLHVSPDYDPDAMLYVRKERIKPREGSVAEAVDKREQERQQWLKKLGDPMADVDDDGDDSVGAAPTAAPPRRRSPKKGQGQPKRRPRRK